MNLSDLVRMGIVATLDGHDCLQLEAPKGALTPALLDTIRQSKPALLAEIRAAREVCEDGELHPSIFTPTGKGLLPATAFTATRWTIHFADRDPLEVWYSPAATPAQVLADDPNALAAVPQGRIEPVSPAVARACSACRHRKYPGLAEPGYCALRTDQPKAYGLHHPLHRLPEDGGAGCASFEVY
jgi:hypothetical protein